jgi:BsuBI/PstI restriction endonuclease domain/BsuBI/PstI restriction endonuclease HTH domain
VTDSAVSTIDQARKLLAELGFDRKQTNERAALVLLALVQLGPDGNWPHATSPMLRTRAIMDWISDEFGVNYKANTRETIRRSTLHQFVDALLVVQNPDEPDRPINSPKSNYQLHPQALEVVKAFGTPESSVLIARYLAKVPGLKAQYDAARLLHRIPITLPNGEAFTLSPGGQNILIKQIVDDFCAYYLQGGHILYVGDADAKWAVFDQETLVKLGVVVDQHGKMPDLVVYLPEKNWLVLLEAASSHGPVDAKRRSELAALFASSTAGLVYVSCFPSRAEMRKYLADIGWETEAWCADNPTHLIHFNGERFLGPYGE